MADSASARTANCTEHGSQPLALVCVHILDALSRGTVSSVGFEEYAPTEEDPEPVALCDSCEAVFREEGIWNDRLDGQVQLKVLCLGCFDGARRMSARQKGGRDA